MSTSKEKNASPSRSTQMRGNLFTHLHLKFVCNFIWLVFMWLSWKEAHIANVLKRFFYSFVCKQTKTLCSLFLNFQHKRQNPYVKTDDIQIKEMHPLKRIRVSSVAGGPSTEIDVKKYICKRLKQTRCLQSWRHYMAGRAGGAPRPHRDKINISVQTETTSSASPQWIMITAGAASLTTGSGGNQIGLPWDEEWDVRNNSPCAQTDGVSGDFWIGLVAFSRTCKAVIFPTAVHQSTRFYFEPCSLPGLFCF